MFRVDRVECGVVAQIAGILWAGYCLDEALAGIMAALGKRLPDEPVDDIAVANSEQDNKDFLRKLQAIIGGERDRALAEAEGLNYELVAELVLLLEGGEA